ncbi:MAG TPA: uracil-DNA glycosylase [Burkholderiaceae bacterium]|jgi:DNA polymerase
MSYLSNRQRVFLGEMGIGTSWELRETRELHDPQTDEYRPPVVADDALAPLAQRPQALPQEPLARGQDEGSGRTVAAMNWSELKAEVAACVKCGLCHGRNNTVFGVGDEKAKWLFIGEGPGRNEDARGEPFVGPAGKLLDNMLQALGLRRGDNAYIANIVKCRPTDAGGKDRPPTAEESAACMPYLLRQIELIQPTVIVALGKTAALSLLQLDPATAVSALRGKLHRYADRPLVVTYHPAYLLRSPADKRKAWADLCLAQQTYARA